VDYEVVMTTVRFPRALAHRGSVGSPVAMSEEDEAPEGYCLSCLNSTRAGACGSRGLLS
jgi:hypothetical protein